MSDPSHLIICWGYPAIFFFVFLGNLGLPVPEESILMLAGFLVWKGDLKFVIATGVGIVSAVSSDNLGYWIGHRYGAKAALRYRRWLFITPDRASRMREYVERYGATGIFLARFLPGVRFMAGPLAGTASMPFRTFFIANFLGAVVYVPLIVFLGYAAGAGLGDFVRRLEHAFGRFEYIALLIIIFSPLLILGWRALKTKRGMLPLQALGRKIRVLLRE